MRLKPILKFVQRQISRRRIRQRRYRDIVQGNARDDAIDRLLADLKSISGSRDINKLRELLAAVELGQRSLRAEIVYNRSVYAKTDGFAAERAWLADIKKQVAQRIQQLEAQKK